MGILVGRRVGFLAVRFANFAIDLRAVELLQNLSILVG